MKNYLWYLNVTMNKIYSAVKNFGTQASHSVTYTGDYFLCFWMPFAPSSLSRWCLICCILWFMCHLLQESILWLVWLSKSGPFLWILWYSVQIYHILKFFFWSLILSDLGFLRGNLFILHLWWLYNNLLSKCVKRNE